MDLLVEDRRCDRPGGNLAMEEALVRAAPTTPVLRLWQNGSCVVVGRGQRVAREAQLAACARDGVPVLRRASGGGAVYQDEGNLNITVVAPGRVPGLVGELAGLVAAAVAELGLAPWIGMRGVFVQAWKVSGLASQVTVTATLAHATFLVTTPAERVYEYLAAAPLDRHPSDSRRVAVRPLCEFEPFADVVAARSWVLAAAAARYGPLRPRSPRAAERHWWALLNAGRYHDPSWHMTGRSSKEGAWTTRPALSSTG